METNGVIGRSHHWRLAAKSIPVAMAASLLMSQATAAAGAPRTAGGAPSPSIGACFTAPAQYATGNGADAGVAGDFFSHGIQDLVTVNSGYGGGPGTRSGPGGAGGGALWSLDTLPISNKAPSSLTS